MTEARSTADELLRNAERLERLLQEEQASCQPGLVAADSALEAGSQTSDFERLWQQQQRLWARSRELHQQGSSVWQQ